MIDSLVLLAELYSCFYLIMAIMIAAGEYRFRKQKPPADLPGVSVVVCARNEEHSIRRCLESLVRLDYPHDKMEILLVDDESEDSTRSILDDYAARYAFFKVLSTGGEPCDLPAKQRPLNLGIRQSSGEIVLVTDADCAVKPGWIKGHVAAYDNEKIGIVGGITSVSTDSGSLFSRIQNFDQVSKLAIAMGCTGLGFPLTIMGNNMSFKRDAYTECGGYDTIGPSIVEDVDLMYAITRNTEYRLGWIFDENGEVSSEPLKNYRTFVEQRRRMLNVIKKTPFICKLFIGIEILMAYLFLFSLTVFMYSPYLLVFISISWIASYFMVMLPLSGITKSRLIIFYIYLVFQFTYGNLIILSNLLGKKQFDWKGRRYIISDQTRQFLKY